MLNHRELCIKYLLSIAIAFLLGIRSDAKTELPWDTQTLMRTVPTVYPDAEFPKEGVRALYYAGLTYKGKPTRVFAYVGLPENASAENPVPGVVCVHGGGGGGTAFDEWVRIWNRRGYAAIAMDLEGQVPAAPDKNNQRPQHPWSGPRRNGIFNDILEPIEDQWMYHAVADVILAHTLLGSLPEVDAGKIGIVGVSWGGIITSVVMGLDNRLAFAVPVYGCGYLFESGNHYQQRYEKMTPEQAQLCRRLWDGSSYLKNAKMPILWLNGTNDSHFYPPIFQKSYLDTQANARLCLKPELRHSHEHAWVNEEIYAFADSVVKKGTPLPNITEMGHEKKTAWITYQMPGKPSEVLLVFTQDHEPDWPDKTWSRQSCHIIPDASRAEIQLPDNLYAYFFNIIDGNQNTISSKIVFNNLSVIARPPDCAENPD